MARKAKTKKQRIVELLSQGKSVPEVCKAVKASPSYVYLVRSEEQARVDKAVGILQMRAEAEQASKAGIPTLRAEQKVLAPKPLTLWQKIKRLFTGE